MGEELARAGDLAAKLRAIADPVGHVLTEAFHFLGLFAIGAATVWSAVHAFSGMVVQGHATIEDLLLLFIYLEIGSMVGIYFKTSRMPVRFLIYVGITALTRHLIGFIQHDAKPDLSVIYLSLATLIMAVAVLVIRYTSHNFPARVDAGSGRETSTD